MELERLREGHIASRWRFISLCHSRIAGEFDFLSNFRTGAMGG
jgi:hypothetical protein